MNSHCFWPLQEADEDGGVALINQGPWLPRSDENLESSKDSHAWTTGI